MNRFLYLVFCFFCALSFNAVVTPAFAAGGAGGSWEGDYDSGGGGDMGAGGAGGSWGDDSGFGGNGGSTGGGGQQCTYTWQDFSGTDTNALCLSIADKFKKTLLSSDNNTCVLENHHVSFRLNSDCVDPPECPVDMHWNGSNCVKDLKCPAGYVKDGDKCIWQCPAGYKMLGGNCVPDDMPEDCDPAIQTCTGGGGAGGGGGEPVCDCCQKLTELVNNTGTIINNQNRVISLAETSVTNQNKIISNTENINNNINQTNLKLDKLINVINQKEPDFDTTGIENKIDELKQVFADKEFNADNINIDMSETNKKIDDLTQAVKDSEYNDESLKLKLDEVIKAINDKTTDLKPITERQDEQTDLLEQIRDLLRPVEQAELAPQLEDVAINAHLDPWSAIRGFDVNQNMINAQAQCPSGDAYSFDFFGQHFAMPMTILCTFLGRIGVGIMFLAYMSAAFIIVKGD